VGARDGLSGRPPCHQPAEGRPSVAEKKVEIVDTATVADVVEPVRAGGHVLVDGRWVIEGEDEV